MIIGDATISVDADTRGFGDGVKRGLGGIGGVAAAVGGTVVAGLGIAGIVSSIGGLGMAYESSLNTFQAVSGANVAQLDKVRETAKALGQDLELPGLSAAGAAEAMTELAKAGLSVDEAMAAAKGTLQLAIAGTISEGEAATVTASALNAFGLEGARASDVANALANAANVSQGEVGDFGAALSQAALVANQAGLSVEETTGALALFAKQGLLGSDAGTSLKTALLRLQAPNEKAAGLMRDLGLNVRDANGEMRPLNEIAQTLQDSMSGLSDAERDAAMSTIFGSDAIRAGTILYGAGASGVDEMTAAVSRQGGAAEVAAAKSKGLVGAVDGLKSTIETVKIDLYERAAPGLDRLTREFTTAIPGAVNATVTALGTAGGALADLGGAGADVFSSNGVQGFLSAVADAATEMGEALEGPAKTALSGARDLLDSLGPSIMNVADLLDPFMGKAVQLVASALTGVLATGLNIVGPVLSGIGATLEAVTGFLADHEVAVGRAALVITAIMAPALVVLAAQLVALGVAAGVSAVKTVAAFVLKGGAAVVAALQMTVASAVFIGRFVAMGVQATISAAIVVAGWVATGLAAVAQAAVAVASGVAVVAGWVAQGIAAGVNAALVVGGWVLSGAAAVAGAARAVASGALVVGSWVLTGVTAMASALVVAAAWLVALGPVGLVIAGVAAVVAIFVTAYKTSETFRNIVNGALETVKRVAGDVTGFLIGGFRDLLNVWLTVAGGIVSGAATALGWVPGVGDKLKVAERAFETMKGNILGTLDQAATAASGYGESAGNNLAAGARRSGDDVRSAGQSLGSALGAGLEAGITAKQGAVRSAARDLAMAARGGLQGVVKAASPSKLTTWMGEMLGEGLALGMSRTLGAVARSGAELGRAATDSVAASAQAPSSVVLAVETPRGGSRDNLDAASIAALVEAVGAGGRRYEVNLPGPVDRNLTEEDVYDALRAVDAVLVGDPT